MVLLDRDSRLLTGSADSELRAWDIAYLQEVSVSNMDRDQWSNVGGFKYPSFPPVSLPPAQVKLEGEPEEKRGKIELVEDGDEDDQEADEGPEEVQATNVWSSRKVNLGCWACFYTEVQ